MNMHATTLDRLAEQAPTMTEAQRNWRIAAIALLSTRFVQGFIYWGGGSRRFIYAPLKLDPSAPTWMANKFQTTLVRHRSSDQLPVGTLLPALCRRHSVQRCRTFRRSDAHDGATLSSCGAVLDGLLGTDVRLARRHLHRRMHDGVLC
jgi:hypothetical protein